MGEWITEMEQKLKIERAGERFRLTLEARAPWIKPEDPVLKKLGEAGAEVRFDGEWVVIVFEGRKEEIPDKLEKAYSHIFWGAGSGGGVGYA
jgi:DNA-directed RNA polymerase subunit H (RpoH/RPB5)